MTKPLASSLALAVSLLCAHAAAAKTRSFQSQGWLLKIDHDPFTTRTRCALTAPRAHLRYQPGAVGFLVGPKRDTLGAWYRVDGGSPVAWQDRTATLIDAGTAIDGPGLDNPTGGWVWVPEAEVRAARSVAIRIRDRGRVRRFRIGGFALMLDAAGRLGCDANAFKI